MEALFLKLLNLSMTAGWLILAVVVLRLVFRKAPRWIFCLLWGLAALRLVVPFSLESALSLIPSAQPIPADIVYQAAPAIDSGIPVVNQVVNPVISNTFAPAPAASVNPLQVVTAVAAWVWLAGLILMLGYALVSYLLLRRRVATATLLRENIKQSERVDSPFVLGLLRPTIYLPYSMDEGDMGHVIAHERAHIHRGDHWWKPLGFLILAVYWFNPLVWVAYILFCRDMELACDEKVAARMAREERQAYSTALLHCGVRRRTVAACPLAFGEVGVKSRVKSVMHYKKPAFWVVLIAVVACIVVAVCFLTVPKDDGPHTLEVTGLPAPESGRDPYDKLDGAERAAAFLKNADMMSYEFSPLLMYGQYIIPTMPATTITHNIDGQTLTINRLNPALELLHNFDLSTLTPIDVTIFDRQNQISSLIHAGDARCRMAIWYDKAKRTNEQEIINSALVFTFADGTMCGFDGGNSNSLVTDLYSAIEDSGSARNYGFSSHITTESNVAVTEPVTGERRSLPAFSAPYVECVFENTPRLSEQVKSEAEFPWKIEILGGGTYWYNPEEGLMLTENNKVYAIGGFESPAPEDSQGGLPSMELMIPGFVVTLFDYGFEMDMNSGKVTITPPSTAPGPLTVGVAI